MITYIAMLRGINVGGHKRIKMDALRRSFESLGFQSVKTYIQSGNVVFKASKIPAAKLSHKIEERILKHFGFPVSVICRTADEMDEMIANNPFLKDARLDPEKFHVMFLSEAPAPAALKKLSDLTASPDQLRCFHREIYFYFPNGVSQSVLFKKPVDRILDVANTTRNWKTVNSVQQMCKDCL